MAVRFALGPFRPAPPDDPLGRSRLGFLPYMTEEEAWLSGCGLWRLNDKKITREQFAVITAEGIVRAVAEITGVSSHGDQCAVQGKVLPAGHPLRDRYIGRSDPFGNVSGNPVAYGALPDEAGLRARACACGCGLSSQHDFYPGHDIRAIRERVRHHFGGSTLAFLDWLDNTVGQPHADGN